MNAPGRRFATWAAAALIAVTAQHSATAQAVISVSDGDSHGTLGDANLSLDEAIQLGNGDINCSNLSNAEKAFVSGTPGPGLADVIDFSFCCFPGTINSSANYTAMHDGLDSIDASAYGVGGIRLSGASTYSGLSFTSSDCSVDNVEFANFIDQCVWVKSDVNPTVLNVDIRNCRFTASEHGVRVTGSDGGVSLVGTKADPIVVRNCEFFDLNAAGSNSRAMIVSGGIGSNNGVYFVVRESETNRTGGGAMTVIGGDVGASQGSDNDVVVQIIDSDMLQNSFANFGPGIIANAAAPGANGSSGNSVEVGVEFSSIGPFNRQVVIAGQGDGTDNDVHIDLRHSRVISGAKGGVVLDQAAGIGGTASVRAYGANFTRNKGAAIELVGSGGSGQTLRADSINSTYSLNDYGLLVSAGNDATYEAFFSDNFVFDSKFEGLRVEPTDASASLSINVQRNAFQRNVDGVRVASGANSGFAVDLGGGSLGSRGENSFVGNTGCGVFNETTTMVSALDNYWGDASGPSDCDAGDSDGITDPTGSGDGVGEYTPWSPFGTIDPNPHLTFEIDTSDMGTILVDDGVSGSSYFLWAGIFILDPPGDTNIGNHFALIPPFFRVFTGKVGTPIGPFSVPNLGGIPITLQAGVFQGSSGELSNFDHKKL